MWLSLNVERSVILRSSKISSPHCEIDHSKSMDTERRTYTVKGEDFTVDDFYRPSKRLGTGAYGMVVSAKDSRTNSKVAIKKVRDCFQSLVDAKRVLREINLVRRLDHPNIVKMTDMINPETKNDFENAL